jgi:acyl-CoA synthetase (AMP-forming)/AMP-acid ligase II/acyl carrier protein
MWEQLGESPHAEFLVTPQYRLTRDDLHGLVRRMLAVFDANGLAPGKRVLILTRNEGTAITAFVAALLDGLVPVMLTPDTTEDRVAAIALEVDPGLIVIDEIRMGERWIADFPTFNVVAFDVLAPRKTLGFGRAVRPEVFLGLVLPEGNRTPRLPSSVDELAYLLFTSGTTKVPCGVMVTRRNILANLSTISRLFSCTPQTRIFNDMVLAHGDGLVQGPLLALANCCTLIRSGGFTVSGMEAWLNYVRLERATHVITVPTIWSMVDRYAQHDDYFDAPECTHLMSVADRLDPDLWSRIETRFKRPLFNQYGLTETVASALYAGPHPEMGSFGTIGLPVDCEARLAPLSQHASKEGELQLRGDNIFIGYWKNAARTKDAFTDDGWMRTGDLAEMNPDGSYKMLGRIKTVIMTGGLLIRPEEIDEVMTIHPAVAQSVTVALPDSDFGEIPVTAVVLLTDTDEATLTSHARMRLETLKVPKRIIFLQDIPRGDAGKPRLNELRAILAAAIQVEAATRVSITIEDSFAAIRALAAEVFRVDPGLLKPTSNPETVPGWDSFSQINLIISIEERFGIRIPAARVSGIRSLGELQTAIQDIRA